MSSKNVWTRGEGAPPVRIEKHIRFDSCRQNDVQRTEKTGKRKGNLEMDRESTEETRT